MADRESEPLLRSQSKKQVSFTSIGDREKPCYSGEIKVSNNESRTRSYWYRWYILGLFSLVASLDNIAWNTWGPIEASARYTYHWSEGTVSLLADWGAIKIVLCVFPSAWLLDLQGE